MNHESNDNQQKRTHLLDSLDFHYRLAPPAFGCTPKASSSEETRTINTSPKSRPSTSRTTARFTVLTYLLPLFFSMTTESSIAGSDNGYHRARFSKHNFSGYCFNTLRCSIEYDGRYEIQTNDPSGPPGPSEMESLEATTIGIPNFPSPVTIHWTSMDGQSHEDQVDLSQIFKHREVIHRAPLETVARDVLLLDPGIILVVNDRSVSVYMRALIPLSEQRADGLPRRKFIDEPVVVYVKDY